MKFRRAPFPGSSCRLFGIAYLDRSSGTTSDGRSIAMHGIMFPRATVRHVYLSTTTVPKTNGPLWNMVRAAQDESEGRGCYMPVDIPPSLGPSSINWQAMNRRLFLAPPSVRWPPEKGRTIISRRNWIARPANRARVSGDGRGGGRVYGMGNSCRTFDGRELCTHVVKGGCYVLHCVRGYNRWRRFHV